MGDLREGILENNIENVFQSILQLKGIKIKGIGTNLSCYGGVKPTAEKMKKLSGIAGSLENKFNIKLDLISGGNSANFEWFFKNEDLYNINHTHEASSVYGSVYYDRTRRRLRRLKRQKN